MFNWKTHYSRHLKQNQSRLFNKQHLFQSSSSKTMWATLWLTAMGPGLQLISHEICHNQRSELWYDLTLYVGSEEAGMLS